MEPQAEQKNNNVIEMSYANKNDLYTAYMPFIKNGALFLQTKNHYDLGDEVQILLQLMDEAEKYQVVGKVIWVTPQCAQEGRKPGIGVQFVSDNGQKLRNKIETYLAGSLQSERRTETM